MIPNQKYPVLHQRNAINSLKEWYRNKTYKDHGALLVIPTGGGKTFVAIRFLCEGPLSDGFKVLWLAESHFLLDQAFSAFRDSVYLIRGKIDLVTRVVSGSKVHFKPRDIDTSDDVVFGTLRTIYLACEQRHPQMEAFIDSAGEKLLVVFDEAHHAPAPTYKRLIDQLRERCKGVFLLGMTATPAFDDPNKGRLLTTIFGPEPIFQVEAAKLMAEGILARPIFEEPKTNFSPEFNQHEYQQWVHTNRDLPENIIEHLARNKERNQAIASTYADNKEKYGKTIMFADRWFQCEQLKGFLQLRGVKAGAIFAKIDATIGPPKIKKDDNSIVLDKFRNGELDVLINVKMLTEGTDVPDVQSVFLTRQTTSKILFQQMIGRALRGPKFGGTEEANIVCFIDEWKQLINFAKFELITGIPLPAPIHSRQTIPLEAISIELVQRLVMMMANPDIKHSVAFNTLLPSGWYKIDYQSLVKETEDSEQVTKLVMIFDNEKDDFTKFIQNLVTEYNCKRIPDFFDEDVALSDVYARLRDWQHQFFAGCMHSRLGTNQLDDLFIIARHVAQNGTAPIFYEFEKRDDHDLDKFARGIFERKLDRLAEDEKVSDEYKRDDRYWTAIYYRYDQFKSQFDICINRRIYEIRNGPTKPLNGGIIDEGTQIDELPEEVKKKVKERDNYRCQCCGESQRRLLQIDHIVPVYYGRNDNPENLQTLCKTCNRLKGIHEFNFKNPNTELKKAPNRIPVFNRGVPVFIDDPGSWEMFIRRTINFCYECGAIKEVLMNKTGSYFVHYRCDVALHEGNDPEWLEPLLGQWLANIMEKLDSLKSQGTFEIDITVTGNDDAECFATSAKGESY
jgi:superfamily II DNA or RNA helicase